MTPGDGGPSVSELLHRWCQWQGCENRVAHARQWLVEGDPEDVNNYIWIRECSEHAQLPDERLDVIVQLGQRLVVQERTG